MQLLVWAVRSRYINGHTFLAVRIISENIIEGLLVIYFSQILCKTRTNSVRSNGRDAGAAVLNTCYA